MVGRDIIVVGASAGGVEALTLLAAGLPPGFPASLFVVCHFPPGSRSVLPKILSRSGPLLAVHATEGERFLPGQIYVAPPDYHMLLAPDGVLRLTRDAQENHHRPAIDPLFRSAARHYGTGVIGVVLTGALNDGSAGLMAIRAAGGIAVAQDPEDALIAAMPLSAAELAGVDYRVPADRLAALLTKLVFLPLRVQTNRDLRGDVANLPWNAMEKMPEVVEQDMKKQMRNDRQGNVSVFTCPECGGALWQVDNTGVVQFRCHVGHAYNGEVLLAEQTEALEAALWTAVRTFREKSVLGRQLAAQERQKGNTTRAERLEEQAAQADQYGTLIVQHVLRVQDGASKATAEERDTMLPTDAEGT
jgi:two-component system chemotaxis response regulator CheB